MSNRSFGQELAKEVIGKAVVWGPPVATGLLLGPAGIVAGAVTAAVVIASRSGGDSSAANTSESKEPGSSS